MTIRTSDLGGSDFSAEGVPSADMNDTFGAVTIHRKKFSTATERTHTGDTSMTDTATTFTFVVPATSLIIGGEFRCDLKISGASKTGAVDLKFVGTSLGTTYFTAGKRHITTSTGEVIFGATFAASSNTAGIVSQFNDSTYDTMSVPINSLAILDASTVITVRIRTNDAAQTVSMQNAELDLVYVEVFKED